MFRAGVSPDPLSFKFLERHISNTAMCPALIATDDGLLVFQPTNTTGILAAISLGILPQRVKELAIASNATLSPAFGLWLHSLEPSLPVPRTGLSSEPDSFPGWWIVHMCGSALALSQ